MRRSRRPGPHLLSEALRLLLVFGQLRPPPLHAARGFLQRLPQLGVAVLQREELRLHVHLTHGPEGTTKTRPLHLTPELLILRKLPVGISQSFELL